MNGRFQAKLAKYSGFCDMKTTATIPTKFLHFDFQILFTGGPKIRWRTAVILKKVKNVYVI